jgi:hypothetical protein
MKKPNEFKTSDVADSMAAAAAMLDVPLETVKRMKRAGCVAFRGSRVDLRTLAKAIAADAEPKPSEILEFLVARIAKLVGNKPLPPNDAEKLTVAIHNGFGAALMVLEPDRVDEFLKKSGAMFNQIFAACAARQEKHNAENKMKR